MTPSIVITDPIPLWKAWAKSAFKLGLVAALCAASFYAGRYYQPGLAGGGELAYSTQLEVDGVPQAVAAPDKPVAATATPQAREADGTQPLADVLASHSLEGLQVQSLQVARNGAVPGQLNYTFELANNGRLFEGRYEFLVLGLKDGRPEQQVITSENASDPNYRLRVARYIKMDGKLILPAGLQAQAVVLSLHESTGVRASRGMELAAR
ncbi:hypothetical protein AZ34_01235 [Hylemonella gracilis str. Niagara R]|uniref:Uncharacterized protein n=2 Tax=Hylemonella gracilis TaxID=80880 RepID=A0A016XKX1_9BURK|nr:hypothetical protein AZ34_01235 [Hylemonella gracilis str. Niagara R]